MEPNDIARLSSNVTVTCEFYRDCNAQSTCKLTFTPAEAETSTQLKISYLNIVPDPSQQRVLTQAKALLTKAPAVLGSKIMQLVATSHSPFAQAMQWILASQEGQCSTTYHGCKDAPGVITLGVGLLTDISSHACPIRRLNEAYPALRLNYEALSTKLNQPQPPLSCDQVNYLLYSTLALSCPEGDSAERAFMPYMLELQDRLMQSSCGLGNTVLSAHQVAMLLTMYFNNPTFVGNKLCAAISSGNNQSVLRQVVLYSDGKNWDIGTQNRQTFTANLLSDVQLPWYQFKKLVLHNPHREIEPLDGEPTNGLPYGDDQTTFIGNNTVQVIHSDEPSRSGKYTENPNDLIVYGTPNSDYFNFTSGGSVVAFGGAERDVLAYESPTTTTDNSQYHYAVSYLAGNEGFDYYCLNALNNDSGEIQINDPDGGAIMLPNAVIAGIFNMRQSSDKVMHATVKFTFPGGYANAHLDVENNNNASLTVDIYGAYTGKLVVNLFKFYGGDYGLLTVGDCNKQFTFNNYLYGISANRYVQQNMFATNNVILNDKGEVIHSFIIGGTGWDAATSAEWALLSNGNIAFFYNTLLSKQIYGSIYNNDGIQIMTLTPSSSYPAIQFCPINNNINIDECSININYLRSLNAPYQAVIYDAVAFIDNTCIKQPDETCKKSSFIKIYDNSGNPLVQVISLPSVEDYAPNYIFGTSLDALTVLYKHMYQSNYLIYKASIYKDQLELVGGINAKDDVGISNYQNGFIMTYMGQDTKYYRAMYETSLKIEQTDKFYSSWGDIIFSQKISDNLVLIIGRNSMQMVTSLNKNIGPVSDFPYCDGALDRTIGVFYEDENNIKITTTKNGLASVIDVPIKGLLTKFNIPADFPALPVISTHHDFPPATTALAAAVFDTGRSLQSIDIMTDNDDVMTSHAQRLSPPSLLSALWFVQRYLSALVPRGADTVSLSQPAIQAEPLVNQGLNALILSPTAQASAYALVRSSARGIPGKPWELTRTMTETRQGVPIFTFHAWDKQIEVGRMSLYAHPLVCRSEDGLRHNMVENTGIFADVVVNPSELTDVCAQLPDAPAVLDYASVGWSAGHGALRGSANVVGQVLRQQGMSDTVSQYVASAIHVVGYWLMSFMRHYYTESHDAMSSMDAGGAVFKAAIKACMEVLYLLLMMTLCGGMSRGANYVSHQASQAGYPKTAKLASFVGRHADKTVYAVNVPQQGLFNTVASVASGSAVQRGVEFVGQALLSRKH